MCLNAEFELLYKVPYDVFSDVMLPDVNDRSQVVFFDPNLKSIPGDSNYGRMNVMTGNSAADIHPIASPGLAQMVREFRFPEIRPPKLSNNGLAVIWGKVNGTSLEQRLLVHDTIKGIDVSKLDTGSDFRKIGNFDATEDGAVFIGEKANELGGVYHLKPNGAVSALFERKSIFPYLDNVQVASSGSISVWYNGEILELSEQKSPVVLAGNLKSYAYVTIDKIVHENGFQTTFFEGDTINVTVGLHAFSSFLPKPLTNRYHVGLRTRNLTTNNFSPLDTVLSFDSIDATQTVSIHLYSEKGYSDVRKSFFVELYDLKEDPFELLNVQLQDDPPGNIVEIHETDPEPQNFISLNIFPDYKGRGVIDEPATGIANLEVQGFMHFPASGEQSGGFRYELVPLNAIPGIDYQPTSGFASLNANNNHGTYTIPILADKRDDPIRYAFLVYSSPTKNLLLPAPSLIRIYDQSWPETISRDYARTKDNVIVFRDPHQQNNLIYRYFPINASEQTFDRFNRKDSLVASTVTEIDNHSTFVGNGFDLVKLKETTTETIFGDDERIAGFKVRTFETWKDIDRFAVNQIGQVVFGANDDVISIDGKKWIAVFRSVVHKPHLIISPIEEVPRDPDIDPFNLGPITIALKESILGAKKSYETDFRKDLLFQIENIGDAPTGPITASYTRYTMTDGVASEPWSNRDPQRFPSIGVGEKSKPLRFEDLISPIFDDKIPDGFQGSSENFETNILHQLKLTLDDFAGVEATATTSACTDHEKYAAKGEQFLNTLRKLGFDNAYSAFNRFSIENGEPFISSDLSNLSKDIANSRTFKDWFKRNIETLAVNKVTQLVQEGFDREVPYALTFEGATVPKENLAFSPMSLDFGLWLTIGGTQPDAPTVSGPSGEIGGRVQIIIVSVSPNAPGGFEVNFHLLVTLEDLYQFDKEDNGKSLLNVFARGQQICGEAQWYRHEIAIDTGPIIYKLRLNSRSTSPGRDAVLGLNSSVGKNGELILAKDVSDLQTPPSAYLAKPLGEKVSSLFLGVSSATFQSALNVGTIQLFGRTGGNWISVANQKLDEGSVFAVGENGDRILHMALNKTGLLNGQDFELGFSFSSSSSGASSIEITSITSSQPAPQLDLILGQDSNIETIAFGDESGGSKTQELIVGNTGDLDLEISQMDLKGGQFRFAGSSLTFPLVLPPGEQRIIPIEFSGLAPATGTITIAFNSGDSPKVIQLLAKENQEAPSITSNIDFNIQSSQQSALQVRATDSESKLLSLIVDVGDSHLFAIDQNRLLFTLQPNDPPSFAFPVKIKVVDSGFPPLSSEKVGTVTVNAPDANSDDLLAWNDIPTPLSILENDSNPIGDVKDLNVEITVQPSFGNLIVKGNSITYQPSASLADGSRDSFKYQLVNSFGVRSSEAIATIQLVDSASKPFQNKPVAEDVNADGRVSPLDALVIINDLNLSGTRQLFPRPFVLFAIDVTGDNSVSLLDALIVINLLNLKTPEIEGEGEGPLIWTRIDAIDSAKSIATNSGNDDSGILDWLASESNAYFERFRTANAKPHLWRTAK